ncbi:hypothetical protein PaG_04477 [Moesziomyces aphidis]|uniref:arginyltransferase n=1 Tax=Moesziomyces aphidis TaxID=84754 RepID=W3VIV5_MOEAP|nr:hypothetical protein PaG_04477 [Moesziomyces aphidis]
MPAASRTGSQLSIVSPTGYTASSCGYCTAPGSGTRSFTKSSRSYGIWAYRLSPYHYQTLIDQGWRRSGDYIYKPDVLRTCCAQIPIRLAVDEYRPTKGQRRALTQLLFSVRRSKPKPARWKGKWSRDRDWDVERRWQEVVPPSDAAEGSSSGSSSAWADRVAGPITNRLEARLALSSFSAEKYELFRRYQGKIHGESEEDISSEKGFRRFLVDSSLTLTWPSVGQPLTASQESAVRSQSWSTCEISEELPYGCYHQEYRLDGKLIAVGVLDILPKCVSSVYVFYDPDFGELQLGKVTALQEIALAKRLGRVEAMREVAYYYLGFYIHGCQKMKYKAEFGPSQLLDCSTNTWMRLADVAAKLEAKQCFEWSSASAHAVGTRDGCETDEGQVRVPTQPRPPPGMLDAQAMLGALNSLVRGGSAGHEASLDLVQAALVLEAQRQEEGINLLLETATAQDDCELVQAVECIAALANAELVSSMVLFM